MFAYFLTTAFTAPASECFVLTEGASGSALMTTTASAIVLTDTHCPTILTVLFVATVLAHCRALTQFTTAFYFLVFADSCTPAIDTIVGVFVVLAFLALVFWFRDVHGLLLVRHDSK